MNAATAEAVALLEPGASALYDAFRALPRVAAERKAAEAQAWVLEVVTRYFDPSYCSGATRRLEQIHVVHAAQRPDAADFLKPGHELQREVCFAAAGFAGMNASRRALYQRHYAEYLRWSAATHGRDVSAEAITAQAQAWAKWG